MTGAKSFLHVALFLSACAALLVLEHAIAGDPTAGATRAAAPRTHVAGAQNLRLGGSLLHWHGLTAAGGLMVPSLRLRDAHWQILGIRGGMDIEDAAVEVGEFVAGESEEGLGAGGEDEDEDFEGREYEEIKVRPRAKPPPAPQRGAPPTAPRRGRSSRA